jgi:hypothetical protein
MNSLCVALTAVSTLAVGTDLGASDLEIAIRTHATEITFGDPLYVEVTIVNRGEEIISALPPSTAFDYLRFEIWDTERNLVLRIGEGGGGLVGGVTPVQYQPGKPVKRYMACLIPSLERIDRSFWSANRGHLLIHAVYRISGKRFGDTKVELRSPGCDLVVHSRDPAETRFLERWAWAEDFRRMTKGPNAGDLGLPQLDAVNPEQTARVASGLQPGEIADLLDLTIRMQNLYHGPPVVPAESNRELVEWLSKMPDIKRQALAKEAHDIASEYQKLSSTSDALAPLFKDP